MILSGNIAVTPAPYRNKKQALNLWALKELNKLHQCISIKGLPDSIPERDIKNQLLMGGWCFVTKVENDLYSFYGTMGGQRDAYYNPKTIIIANPWLNVQGEYENHVDGELIRNDTCMIGFGDMIYRYGQAIVENQTTLSILGLHLRGIDKIIASNKRSKDSADKYYEKLEEGELSVILDQYFARSISTDHGALTQGTLTQLLEIDRYWRATYAREIGLNENYNSKRESISAGETEMSEDPLTVYIENVLDNWRDGFDRVNKMYGTNITVELKGPWKQHMDRLNAEIDIIQDQSEADGDIRTEDGNESREKATD